MFELTSALNHCDFIHFISRFIDCFHLLSIYAILFYFGYAIAPKQNMYHNCYITKCGKYQANYIKTHSSIKFSNGKTVCEELQEITFKMLRKASLVYRFFPVPASPHLLHHHNFCTNFVHLFSFKQILFVSICFCVVF